MSVSYQVDKLKYCMKAYRYRAYPTEKQLEQIKRTAGCCRFVYNYILDKKIECYKETGKTLNLKNCSKLLTALKHDGEHPWLNEAESTALIQSLRDLETAYKNFFRDHKHFGFPKFRSKKENRCKYRSENVDGTIRFENGKLRIAKFGYLKVRNKAFPKGRILNSTIEITESGKCFVALCCDEDVERRKRKNDRAVGCDLGLKDFSTVSDGRKYNLPERLEQIDKKIVKIQKKLSRSQEANIDHYVVDEKGYRHPVFRKKFSECRNYQKLRVKLARLYETKDNIKKDFFNKLSIKICRENQTVCFEDLNIKGMSESHWLAKRVHEVSWASFLSIFENQAAKFDTQIVKVGRFYPSSKMCSCCGFKKIDLKLKDREWTCPECGSFHDRDLNASVNILNEGLRILNCLSDDNPQTDRQSGIACGDSVRLLEVFLPKAIVNEAGSALSALG